jgi:hypothetical protein
MSSVFGWQMSFKNWDRLWRKYRMRDGENPLHGYAENPELAHPKVCWAGQEGWAPAQVTFLHWDSLKAGDEGLPELDRPWLCQAGQVGWAAGYTPPLRRTVGWGWWLTCAGSPMSVPGWSGRVRHRLLSSTKAQARLRMKAYLSWLAHECARLVRKGEPQVTLLHRGARQTGE